MRTRWYILVIVSALFVAGCRSTLDTSQATEAPDLSNIVFRHISFHSNTVSEIVMSLSQQMQEQYPKGAPVQFQLGAGHAREKGRWTQAAPGYCLFIPDEQTNTEFGCRITFHAKDISLPQTLHVLSNVAMVDWWTDGNTVIVDSNDPVFQAPFRQYDPQARGVLDSVLNHLVSDPDAKRMVDMYLGSHREDGASPLKRLRLQTASFPDGYTPTLSAVATSPASGGELDLGDLFVSVHRYLSRGRHARKVVLFITAAGIGGGGWVTYIAENSTGTWHLDYRGCYDP